MIRPRYLRQGDVIGVVAPAGSLLQREIESALDLIRSWGLQVKPGKHLFKKKGSFAGSDDQRFDDLQSMLDSADIQAVLCARGGYGTLRIIDRLNFEGFKRHPKWLVGYSDITILHSALQLAGFESIHGAMPRIVSPAEPDLVSFDSLRAMLFGETGEYSLPPHHLNRKGSAEGILTGGNLSVLHSMAGTPFDIDTAGKILFIEDVGEYLYHVDRMMMNLKLRGRLSGLAGLIIGDMTDMKSSPSGYRTPAFKIINDAVAGYDYPVIYAFPAGHATPNLALPFGRNVSLTVTAREVSIKF